MSITLGELKLSLDKAVGTSETNLMTQDRRVYAINRAVEKILQMYDIHEYTIKTNVSFNTGTGLLPADCLRISLLRDENQNIDYDMTDFEAFNDHQDFSYKLEYDTTSEQDNIYMWPQDTKTMTVWYIQQATRLVNDGDKVKFKNYWDDAIAEKAAEFLFTDTRNFNAAQAKQTTANDKIEKAWQNDRQRLVGKEAQKLTSVFSRRRLLRESRTPYTNNYSEPMGIIRWIKINTNVQGQSFYGYDTDSASKLFINLPLTSALGDIIEVAGMGAGGWKISQNAGQYIIFESNISTIGAGGSLESNIYSDSCRLECIIPNIAWTVLNSQGNLTIT